MLGWLDSKKLSQNDLYDVNRAFNYKYGKDRSGSFNHKESNRYWIDSGIEIWVRPDQRVPNIEITNLPQEKEVKNFRRIAKLAAAKKAANKFLPQNAKLQEN